MNEWTGSDLDGLGDEQAIERLTVEFPDWVITRGVNMLCHAWPRDNSERQHVRGEDWTDLRDELIREVWRDR